MPRVQFEELLSSAGDRMTRELRERLVPHRGELGTAREEVLRQFLRAYLPRRYDISTGFVIDVNGDVSQQLDIIIVDSAVAPRFEAAGGTRFYPCECVVAVGQVKSSLTSRRELWEAIENVRSASILDRSAGGHAVCTRTAEPIDHHSNHLHRIFTFIFVVGRALASDTAVDVLLDAVHRGAPSEWPNLLFSLEKYLVTFCCDNGVCPNTMHARGISTVDVDHEREGLLRFYMLLAEAITATSVANMSSRAYLRGAASLRGETVCCTPDEPGEPPRYLESLNMLKWRNPYVEGDDEPQSDDG